MKPLARSFYKRNTVVVAFELIGKLLVFNQTGELMQGKIVETEAYLGDQDPASHAYRGVTPRNRVMFGFPGVSYIYFTYGNHHCFNIVTEEEHIPGAVLIRALEPVSGISIMKKRRGTSSHEALTSGPGKLTQAFGMTREHSGRDLTQDESFCVAEDKTADSTSDSAIHIQTAGRIGISTAKSAPYRFYLRNSPFVSVVEK